MAGVSIIGLPVLAGAALTGMWFVVRGVNVRKLEARLQDAAGQRSA